MAIEKNGQMTYVDEAGNEYLLFPKTKIPQVEGLEAALATKAPAGFGLGDVAPTLWSGSVTDITKSGWYWYQDSTASGGPYHEGVILASIGPYHSRLDFFALHGNEYNGCHAVRVKNWNGWQEWEWENPPMILGVEYRTTERWNGKVVWKIALDFGVLPNASHKYIAMPVNGLADYVRFFLKTTDDNGNHRYIAGDGSGIKVCVAENWKFLVITDGDWSQTGGILEVHYTKN